ncbi:macro domain-containing protein 2 [Elsinoe australis]|uniref:ADP-ribose 1''-phosphate phosphatase n=1 Tax=Elsinoe australis TaxID=40998 RepID=A0A4U7APZ5_9PEZI|nr:macro domain-containing protein 2 [Elsinoe australis]
MAKRKRNDGDRYSFSKPTAKASSDTESPVGASAKHITTPTKAAKQIPQTATPSASPPVIKDGALSAANKEDGSALIKIVEVEGDLFSAPPNTVLVHACNCKGVWGNGIAKAFRIRYPGAYKICGAHCNRSQKAELSGTALLIEPQTNDKDKHFVGNLFTSKSYGRTKDSPDIILKNTDAAMRGLLGQIAAYNDGKEANRIERIWMCKINSGLFNVPWKDTKALLGGLKVPERDAPGEITVMFQG